MASAPTLLRTDRHHPELRQLVARLDAYLAVTDGDEHDFYDQFNHLDDLRCVVLAFQGDEAIACGALKHYDAHTAEIKRMYVDPTYRKQGLASLVLEELEAWARELTYGACILETGKRQTEAVAFYRKNRYMAIPKYGPYKEADNSLCFKKML